MKTLELKQGPVEKIMSNLQIVVIDSFYDTIHLDESMDWLGKLFQFKLESYRNTYPYGILPFGTSDLVGTHWILCKKEFQDLSPIMGFKTIDQIRCKSFRLDYPALSLVGDPGSKAHQQSIQAQLEQADRGNYKLGYAGSWTISPSVHKDRILSKVCKKMSSAFYSLWVQEFDVRVALTFAVLKFQVDSFHQYLGMSKLPGIHGEVLPEFTPSLTFGERTSISLGGRDVRSKACIQDMEDMMPLWNQRISIVSETSPLRTVDPLKKAA